MDRRHLPVLPESDPVEPAETVQAQQQPFSAQRPLRAPEGAPNVLVVLLDDMGFGASSAFGGPCAMPATEQLAENGLRYNRFHTTAICSPTRAALLTGRNHHSVGMGNLPHWATNAPGYNALRQKDTATLAQTLKHNGYATGAFGKWHQTPDWEITPAGPFDRWPTGEGFDTFYGIMGGESSQFTPTLYDGTTPVDPPATEEEGYHLSEDLVDRASDWIRRLRTYDGTRPWFTYLSFGATHAPFHLPRSWRGRNRGDFAHGWDRQRELTLERQKEAGVVPADAELAPWTPDVPHWDELTPVQQEAAQRLMEAYASFTEHTDQQIGRLIDFLRDTGELDNTLVFVILGDNGAAAEGGLEGALNEHLTFNGLTEDAQRVVDHADEIGGPLTYPHYPVGWAVAMNAPFQWTKQVASHFGGTRNGLVVHWPAGIAERGGLRQQFSHVIDIAPTILEAVGVPQPETVDGVPQRPIEGTSMVYTFDDAAAPDRHTTQYFEILGNRGIYHEGWTAQTKHRTPWLIADHSEIGWDNDVWELYDTNIDWTQAHDLAAEQPEKLAELQQLFLDEARNHNVLPLDDRVLRPDVPGFERPDVACRDEVTLTPSDQRIPERALPNLKNTSFSVTVSLVADSDTSDGVLVAQGGYVGGWSLYVEDGVPVYVHNRVGLEWHHVRATRPVPVGPHDLELRFSYDGGGIGLGGTVTLVLDGEEIGSGRVEATVPITFSTNETANIGIDRGSPVTTGYRRGGGNPYTGDITTVRISVGSDSVPAPAGEVLRAELAHH